MFLRDDRWPHLSVLDNLMPLQFPPSTMELDSSFGIESDRNLKSDKIKGHVCSTGVLAYDDFVSPISANVWRNESPLNLADLSSTTGSTTTLTTSSSHEDSLIRDAKEAGNGCCFKPFTKFDSNGNLKDYGRDTASMSALNSFNYIFKENMLDDELSEFTPFNEHQRQTLMSNGIAVPSRNPQYPRSLAHTPLAELSPNNDLCQLANKSTSTFIPLDNHKKHFSTIIRPWLQFGGFGTTNANFTEPNSVVLSEQGNIIVADTNSHQIKLFDANGRFLYKFGEAGKSHGKMLYPCKIDLLPAGTNRIAIVQRNPMPQIQIFKLNGQYENRFARDILKFPRAMCVDEMGSIIVIESKVMTCHIFSPDGRYLRKLQLQNDLNFPFDICAHNGEIFISDNQAHCIKVFDYSGKLRRKIGEGVVKFPVCLDYCSVKKSLFITDNHERLNVNQFSLSGKLLNSYYSGIKHAQCYDVTTSMDDMILASKDYRIYRYKLPGSNHMVEGLEMSTSCFM